MSKTDQDLEIKVQRVFCSYYGHLEETFEYYDDVDDNGKDIKVKHGFYLMYGSENPTFPQRKYHYAHNKLHGYQLEYEWDFEHRLEGEGAFDNGTPVGEHKSYNYLRHHGKKEHRETRVGTYVNGRLHGTVQEMLDDGTIVGEAVYNNGVKESMWTKDSSVDYQTLDRCMMLDKNGMKRGISWARGAVVAEWQGIAVDSTDPDDDDLVCITHYVDYEVIQDDKTFKRTDVHFDDFGNTLSGETFYESGELHEKYIVVPNPERKLQTTSKANCNSHPHLDTSNPGVPWFGSVPYLPDDYRRDGIQRIEYYRDGSVKMANMMNGRQFEGEFRYYAEDGSLLSHSYYHKGKDVTDDVLEIAECDSLDDISEDAEVFLTLQYGALMMTPKELLCPIK